MKRIMILAVTAAVIIASAMQADGSGRTRTRSTRPSARVSETYTHKSGGTGFFTDTLPGTEKVRLFGYDKTAGSFRESIFITNHASDSLVKVSLDLSYTDISGRPLHRCETKLSCSLAPGETKRVDFPSWDHQRLFYYYLSPKPGSNRAATPYKITVKISSATFVRNDADKAQLP